MRLTSPRIPILPRAEWPEERREDLEEREREGILLNITRTLLQHPQAEAAFRPWARYISIESTLDPRQREIPILRIGYLCRSGYEWGQHVRFALAAGLSAEEIERVKAGAQAPGWSGADAVLIKATDELFADQFVSDATWAELSRWFEPRQCVDVVLAVAQYQGVSMILNTLGVQLDEGMTLDPDLKAF